MSVLFYADSRASGSAYEQINLINPDNAVDSITLGTKSPDKAAISPKTQRSKHG